MNNNSHLYSLKKNKPYGYIAMSISKEQLDTEESIVQISKNIEKYEDNIKNGICGVDANEIYVIMVVADKVTSDSIVLDKKILERRKPEYLKNAIKVLEENSKLKYIKIEDIQIFNENTLSYISLQFKYCI